MELLDEISQRLQQGMTGEVKRLVQRAIDEGVPAQTIWEEGLRSGMDIIGEKFKRNEVFVPEVLRAAGAMNQAAALLRPLLAASGGKAAGKVCIGTVRGDLHDIGKNLVKMMMEGKGIEVIDLGTDVAPETFIKTAVEQDCQIIACSALLTTTMGVMGEVVKAAEAANIRDHVKIMVGGAPVTEAFCEQIGADCYTADAASAAGGTLGDIYEVQVNGEAGGYAVTVSASGSQGTIEMMVGVDASGAVTGVSVINHSETSGIGTKVVGNEPTASGVGFGDSVAGMFLTQGILYALYHRERTGQGQYIDVSMVDSLVALLQHCFVQCSLMGQEPERIGNRDLSDYPYDLFEAKDGYCQLGNSTPRDWSCLLYTSPSPRDTR